MFGYHKAKRRKKRVKREEERLQKEQEEFAKEKPQLELEKEQRDKEAMQQHVTEQKEQGKKERAEAREEGKKYAEEFLSRDVQGLTPEQKSAMQFEANRQIKRSHQNANRKLLGQQSQHGIVGKGGVGYAQQADLLRMADEARGQANRDLTKLDADLALKKLAAMFNIEQGEVGQTQLDKQMAIDELNAANEKKRLRQMEDEFNKILSRI
jgi:Mrp family chromosome partitioning ATPase